MKENIIINLLSIDWDYFINVSPSYRQSNFPEGDGDLLDSTTKKILWKERYKNIRSLQRVDIMKISYYDLVYFLNENAKYTPIVMAHWSENHKSCYDMMKEIVEYYKVRKPEVEVAFNIVNIDFHHDFYDYQRRDGEVNCGNWLKRACEKFNVLSVQWVRQESSDIESLAGNVFEVYSKLTPTTLKNVISGTSYNAIFLCRSDIWSPPHLDNYFADLRRWIEEWYEHKSLIKKSEMLMRRESEVISRRNLNRVL